MSSFHPFQGYQILAHIGNGSSASVYQAIPDTQKGHVVAIKYPSSYREIAMHRLLSSSYTWVPQYLEEGEYLGFPFLVMSYVEGQSLWQKMEQRGLSLQEWSPIVSQVLKMLHALQVRDVPLFYSDLHHGNLMLSSTGDIFLIDMESLSPLPFEERFSRLFLTKLFGWLRCCTYCEEQEQAIVKEWIHQISTSKEVTNLAQVQHAWQYFISQRGEPHV